jgi:hypothetical protein
LARHALIGAIAYEQIAIDVIHIAKRLTKLETVQLVVTVVKRARVAKTSILDSAPRPLDRITHRVYKLVSGCFITYAIGSQAALSKSYSVFVH